MKPLQLPPPTANETWFIRKSVFKLVKLENFSGRRGDGKKLWSLQVNMVGYEKVVEEKNFLTMTASN